jgi:hypothetical protein
MEPKDSLLCSQELATGPYPKPDKSSPSYFINFNIILPYMPRSSKSPLPFRFSHHNPICISLLSHVCHISCSSHPPWYDDTNNMWQGIKIIKLFIPLSYVLHLRPKCIPQHRILEHPQPMCFLQCERPTFTLTQNNRQDQCFLPYNLHILT